MRKLIMWNVATLDGYFEGKEKWDLSFHDSIWGPEVEKFGHEQLRSADYIVFGRVTYEGMADYWKKAEGETARLMNSIPKIVFSKTLKEADWQNTTLINEDASTAIARLKAEGNGEMYVFGSADLSQTLINHDLFDEYRIVVAPVILGNGTPLFKPGTSSRNLSLLSSQPLTTGGVILRFGKKE